MNHKKFGRFIGVGQSYGGEIPPVLVQLPLDRLARAPASGGVATGTATSYYGFRYIDPPVGGFADGDLLEQLPYQFAHRTITAVHAGLDSAIRFAPGLYRIHAGFGGSTSTQGRGLYWKFSNATPEEGWAVAGSDGPELGGVQFNATGSWIDQYGEFYFPGNWYAALRAFGAHTDANVSFTSIEIIPIHLLDEFSSAR